MKMTTIRMEMAALVLLILTKNSIFILNSSHILLIESFHFSINLISKPHLPSLLLVLQIGKLYFQINLKVKPPLERFRLPKSLKMLYFLIEILTINLFQNTNQLSLPIIKSPILDKLNLCLLISTVL